MLPVSSSIPLSGSYARFVQGLPALLPGSQAVSPRFGEGQLCAGGTARDVFSARLGAFSEGRVSQLPVQLGGGAIASTGIIAAASTRGLFFRLTGAASRRKTQRLGLGSGSTSVWRLMADPSTQHPAGCDFCLTALPRASMASQPEVASSVPAASSAGGSERSTRAGNGGRGGPGSASVLGLVGDLVTESLRTSFPEIPDAAPQVAACKESKFGDYQCNNAMPLFAKLKGNKAFPNPRAIGQTIEKNLPPSPLVSGTSIAGPGFVNITLSPDWMAARVEAMLVSGIESWAPPLGARIGRAVVDFSSPNIAKEMHVGHLRSTIIGDCIARSLEFCGVEVLRRNHVGDWGTQFGMLIEYLFEQFPNWEEIGEQAIGDLQAFYKAAKNKFDVDAEFKDKAQKAVVKLQGGDPMYRSAWTKICDVSRNEFAALYDRLHVVLEERGESFYNPFIPATLEELENKGLTQISEGATCVFFEGSKLPLIVRKTDGGFNYASTDLTCLKYRINEEKANWIIYVTDVGQAQHFDMVFKTAHKAGWLPTSWGNEVSRPRINHVGFGLVLGEDGKRFRTRSGDTVRLVDLLDEAVNRSKAGLVERGREGEWTEQEIAEASAALGYGAVKYADLKQNRITNYTFSYDQMLDIKGNTAVYLLYAHARICSIIRKSGEDIEVLKMGGGLVLEHPAERALGLQLLRFPETLEESIQTLLPNTICEYLYQVSVLFSEFYQTCQVLNSPDRRTSRLLLCEATAVVMRQCFKLLGITPLYKL